MVLVEEEIYEILFGAIPNDAVVYALIGRRSERLLGVKIDQYCKVKLISMSDIDHLDKIVKTMKGEREV